MTSIVTDADLASDAAIRAVLTTYRPNDLIFSEEGQPVDLNAPRLWIVDPLDGTTNYAHGIPVGCVAVAYAEVGTVVAGAVFDPFRNEMFTALKGKGARLNGHPIGVSTLADPSKAIVAIGSPRPGQPEAAISRRAILRATEQFFRLRIFGSTALELCWVACGRIGATANWSSHWWDVAAAAVIVVEAGGAFTPSGRDWRAAPTSTSIGSNGRLHATLERLLRD